MTAQPKAQEALKAHRKNKALLLAAGLAAASTLLHVVGGGEQIARPILDSPLADEVRLPAYVVWHMVTLMLGLSAGALAIAALPRHAEASRYLVGFVSALWIGSGMIFVAVAAAHDGGVEMFFIDLGQWIILVPVGLLGLWGIRRGAAA